MERVTGVEPVLHPWQGRVIPLYDTRANSSKKNVPGLRVALRSHVFQTRAVTTLAILAKYLDFKEK